jgi:DNA-binding transcriptional ArsR family regulator
MPNQTTNQTIRLDRVFQALADPTRRAVLEQLSRGPAAVSVLAEPFRMALPSFLQHLRVLEDCGLVRSRKTGRVRTFRVVARPMQAAEGWLAQQRSFWERRLDQFDGYVQSLKEKRK